MRLIVAGSRTFADAALFDRKMAEFASRSGPFEVVSGMAPGADALAVQYARREGLACHGFPADWKSEGRAAGHARNGRMAAFADALLAFWDGTSPGTENMIRQMEFLDKPVEVVLFGEAAGVVQVPTPPLRAGMTRKVGLHVTTSLPDFDFETYSEAGYIWDAAAQKWRGPEGASQGKKGLPVVGVAVYAQHPTTEVLCMAYDLKDGAGRRFWHPKMAPPHDLLDHVRRGGALEAWNVAFEWWIWNEVCVRRYGWPPLRQEQTFDAMAKARAHALPGALGEVSRVLDLQHKKDAEGDRLLKKFAMPRNPTKADGRLRIIPDFDDPADEDAQALKRYNLRDIEAEAEASWKIPDIAPDELQVWRTDQRINRRGIALDMDAVNAVVRVIKQAHASYGQELQRLAGCYPTELQRLRAWLGSRGVYLETMDEDAIELALRDTSMPPDARRALEIRQAVGSASIKKVFAVRNQVARGNRLHDLYSYHGAHTGRPTGSATNLPRSGPDCWECATCGHHHNTQGHQCPWCFTPFDRSAKRHEWSPEAMEDAITIAKTGSLSALEWFFTDAMHALAGTLRGMFVAKEGHEFVSSDFSAIEGVVTAALAGEEWRLEVFRTHGMIYEMSAAKIIGEPFEAFVEYKKVHKKHHPARQGVGKVAELACLAGDTLVLTHLGPVPLSDVTTSHLVHDGVAWVAHQGLVSRGVRSTVELAGIRATPDHNFLGVGGKWVTTADLRESTRCLRSAILLARSQLCTSCVRTPVGFSAFSASAPVGGSASSICIASCGGRPRAATLAQSSSRGSRGGGTKKTRWTGGTCGACSTGYLRRSPAAPTRITRNGRPMAVAGSRCSPRGSRTAGCGSSICSPRRGGATRRPLAIASTTIRGTSRGTSGLFRTRSSSPTSGARCGSSTTGAGCRPLSSGASSALRSAASRRSIRVCAGGCPPLRSSRTRRSPGGRTEPVFDLLEAGPRNRFVVLTDRGPLIAHNCGFGGWINAMKAFGAERYLPTDEDMKRTLLAWREASPAVVHLWGGQKWGKLWGLEGGIMTALRNPGASVPVYRLDGKPTGITYTYVDDVLYAMLPSGRALTYHRPRIAPSADEWRGDQVSYEGWNTNPKNGPPGWIRKSIYGGRATENVVQAVARDIQMNAIERLEAIGYPVVMHTYDEIVSEVPKGTGCVLTLEREMATLPEWASGWPIRAAGGWVAHRYRKG